MRTILQDVTVGSSCHSPCQSQCPTRSISNAATATQAIQAGTPITKKVDMSVSAFIGTPVSVRVRGTGISNNATNNSAAGGGVVGTPVTVRFAAIAGSPDPNLSQSKGLFPPLSGENLGLAVRYAGHQSQGTRTYMEDTVDVRFGQVPALDLSLCIFGVYDGHGGAYVAQSLQDSLGLAVLENLKNLGDIENLGNFRTRASSSGDEESKSVVTMIEMQIETQIEEALLSACASMDRQILSRDYERKMEQRHGSLGIGLKGNGRKKMKVNKQTNIFAGSTSSVMVLYKQKKQRGTEEQEKIHIALANVGDCRAVVCIQGKSQQLTTDHRPSDPQERARVEKAGGYVEGGRVGGSLGVARSFGDLQYKSVGEEVLVSNVRNDDVGKDLDFAKQHLWGEHQQVVSRPEVVHLEVRQGQHEFVVMASDGLWDVLSNDEVCNFVRFQLLVSTDVRQAARLLVEEAEGRARRNDESVDNISAVVCCLNQK